MGLLDKVTATAKNVGSGIATSAVKVGSNVGTSVQDNSEIAGLKMKINSIDQELEASYATIGRQYVKYVMDSGEMPGIDVTDVLKLIDPKLAQKQELEAQLVEAEKRVKDADILRAKEKTQHDFEIEKSKLDKALQMDVISQDEYNYKLSIAYKRVENFEEIRKVEAQCNMGLISLAERNAKIDSLLQ